MGAYGSWGLMPLYWKSLGPVPSTEILSHRVVWSLLFFALLLRLRSPACLSLSGRPGRVWWTYLISGCLIGANWLTFIWAVTRGHVLQASLGYFLCPLATVAVGALFFKERLTARQKLAVLLAASGAGVLVWHAAHDLWIALLLTLTFCLYGVARRLAPLPSLEGMYLETLILTPIALASLAWAGWTGHLAFWQGTASRRLLLMGAGPMTGLPLLMFSEAALRLPLSHLGLFQYISPTLQFLLAVLYYQEAFTSYHAWTFGLIWLGLVIFTTAPKARLGVSSEGDQEARPGQRNSHRIDQNGQAD